jgi:hypothetical protein
VQAEVLDQVPDELLVFIEPHTAQFRPQSTPLAIGQPGQQSSASAVAHLKDSDIPIALVLQQAPPRIQARDATADDGTIQLAQPIQFILPFVRRL